MNFLSNLDFLLKENHMSRAELARRIGIAHSTVNAWYNKSCDGVGLKTLRDIAELFNVSLEALVNSDNIESIYFSERSYTKRELKMISEFGKLIRKSRE